MDPRRALVERNAHFTRGPRFFREGEVVLFEFVIDATNVMGPRPATARDRSEHSGAYRDFMSQDMDEAAAVAPESPRRPALDMAAEVYHPEIDFGPPVGREFPNAERNQGPPVRRAYRRKARPEETV